MGVRKTKEEESMKPKAAEELARQIVADHLTMGDIEWLIRNHSTNDPRREKLLAAVSPGYPKVREELAIELGYCKVSDTPEIEDLHWQEVNAYAAAAFQLG